MCVIVASWLLPFPSFTVPPSDTNSVFDGSQIPATIAQLCGGEEGGKVRASSSPAALFLCSQHNYFCHRNNRMEHYECLPEEVEKCAPVSPHWKKYHISSPSVDALPNSVCEASRVKVLLSVCELNQDRIDGSLISTAAGSWMNRYTQIQVCFVWFRFIGCEL